MVVIVDGYNVIRLVENISSSSVVSEGERHKFISRLQGYALRRKQSIKRLFIVFDGGDSRHSERYERGLIAEVYSGFVDSADDWIVQHVSRSGFSEYVVVTNDRGLKKRVKPYVKLILSAEEFSILLKQSFADAAGGVKKTSTSVLVEYGDGCADDDDEDREYLRELMERSTRGMLSKKSDDAHEEVIRASGSSTDSKELIRVRRIVKKL